MQEEGPKVDGWSGRTVERDQCPCPDSFTFCSSSSPCVWVISNLFVESVCIRTYLHTCLSPHLAQM